MKYAVIAALLASNTQALTGCKKGLGTKIYSDDKCKEATTAEFTLLDKDVEKTGSCQSFKATEADENAVTKAAKTLKTKQAVAKKAKDKYTRNQDVDVVDANGKKGPANEIFDKTYPTVQKAYFAMKKSQAVVEEYVDDNADEKADVATYKKEYEKLFVEQAKTKAAHDKTATEKAVKNVAAAEKTLAKNCDPKIIQTEVADEAAFAKLVAEHIPKEQRANYLLFLERDYNNVVAAKAVKDQENVLETVSKRADQHTYSKIITCDAKAGVHIKYYDGVGCKDKPDQEYTAKWGKCTKMGDNYFKITGAATLQAAAVAIVAFAGSQF